MPGEQVSRTAFGTAYMRASHLLLDPPPHILDDSVILKLLGQQAADRIIQSAQEYQTPERRGLRSHVVLRSRAAEDRLAAAVQRGITQYVILGAGLDTFAYRQPAWARSLRIVEVDHAGTQTAKRGLIKKAELPVPENVVFAAVNFEYESLQVGLKRYQVSLEQPTFFSRLGVTMYLNEQAIDATLHSIASFPQGSEVVLTFARADGPPSPFDRKSEELGEKWLSYFTRETMDAKLHSSGFHSVEFLEASDAAARYFTGEHTSLRAPKHTNIVFAQV